MPSHTVLSMIETAIRAEKVHAERKKKTQEKACLCNTYPSRSCSYQESSEFKVMFCWHMQDSPKLKCGPWDKCWMNVWHIPLMRKDTLASKSVLCLAQNPICHANVRFLVFWGTRTVDHKRCDQTVRVRAYTKGDTRNP